MLGSRLPATFAGLTLVAALAAPTGTTAAAPAGAIAWTTCEQPAAAKYQARCGTVRVPVDWAKPSGPSIALALLRVPATGDSTGTVVSDSEELAGYGGSQISFFLQHGGNYLSRLPRTHATKDIVIFDPRGLGGSAGVHCAVPGHDPAVSSFATSVGTYDRLLAHNAATFAGCQGTAGLTAHMGVHDQVRDLDAIRSALGESRLNWLGQADGGERGAAYAAAYPGRTGAIVLDAAVDPNRSAAVRAIDAASAEETAFTHFATWCDTDTTCALHGQDVGKVFDQVVAKADAGGVSNQAPSPRPLTGAEIRITAGQYLAGYPFAWPGLAAGIASAANGNGQTFATYSALTYTDPDYTASRIQTCADSPAPAGLPRLRLLAQLVRRSAPHTGGLSIAWEAMAGCVGQPTAHPYTLPARVRPSSSILVTGTTGDPISPYAWTRSLASDLAGSRLVTATIDGHGAFDNSPCADGVIDGYLANGTLPAANLVCRT
ncbi:alpha/beta hydrolase [Fodinicola feengrottensis]|uniref:Alpha/beta hydrolase n=1 Tax=Fodinicola feengrottensis TaxID=435914 RepID=A0ABN2FRR5_9ACTN